MCRIPLENVAYNFLLTFPAVPSMLYSFYLSGLWDERQVTIQLLFCGVVASRICLRRHIVFLCSSRLVFFSVRFVSIHPYSCTVTAITWKKSSFILSDKSDFHMIDSLSIVFHTFARCMWTSLSVDEMLLPRFVNRSTDFKGLLRWVATAPFFF